MDFKREYLITSNNWNSKVWVALDNHLDARINFPERNKVNKKIN